MQAGKRSLILIGYWRSDREPQWPDPEQWIDEAMPEYARQLVADFLRAGQRTPWVAAWPSFCRLCGSGVGNGERTEGTFVWPDGLAHYVADHRVRLPAKFVGQAVMWADQASWEIDPSWWRAQQPGA